METFDEDEDDNLCPTCGGSGGIQEPALICPVCKGTGEKRRKKRDDEDYEREPEDKEC